MRWLGLVVLLAGGPALAGCGGAPPAGRAADIRPTDVTARAAFRAAALVGWAWRPDARLAPVSTAWQDLRTGRGAWAGGTALVVTVAGGRAEAGPGTALEEVVFLDRKVDSDGALEAFLRAGGEGPGAGVTARLRPAPEWQITALGRFRIRVDASDGNVAVGGGG